MARENLSDYIVVGRPIYKNENPRAVCEKILNKIHRKNISENDIEQNYEVIQQKNGICVITLKNGLKLSLIKNML